MKTSPRYIPRCQEIVDDIERMTYNACTPMTSQNAHNQNSAKRVSRRGEVLVAVMNNLADWRIATQLHWYRIPVETAPRRWPPQWVAFYQTKIFGDEAFSIRYFAKVAHIKPIFRRNLFPDEPENPKSDREYYQVLLDAMERREPPIVSYRLRRIAFIPTTYHKFMTAKEVNDLFDDSPLEDALWDEMKKLQIRAERQYYLKHLGQWFALDFAVFCEKGNVDIETDGDAWHATPDRIPEDNRRNNALAAQGYHVLRFNTMQVREEMTDYCVPKIVDTINRLGGVQDPDGAPRTYVTTKDGIAQQMNLFEIEDAPTEPEQRAEPSHDGGKRISALGKYAFVAGGSEEFALEKQNEIDREDRAHGVL